MTIEVAGADVTARPAAGDLDVSGRLDTLRVDALGRREQIDRVALDGRLSADLVRIRQIDWRWQGEAMHLDGEMRRPWVASRELSLRVKGDVPSRRSRRQPASISRDRRQGPGAAEITGRRRGWLSGPIDGFASTTFARASAPGG